MRWRESVKMTDHILAATEYDEGSVGRISSLMLDVRELQEPVLYAVALRPMQIERAGHLTYEGKRRCLENCYNWGRQGGTTFVGN